MKVFRFTALVALFAVVSLFAFGQTETGSISGTVTDPSGAVVSGATVTTTNLATQAKRTVTTNANGLYFVGQLPPGQYQLEVASANFAPYKQTVGVAVGSRNEASVQLQVAAGSTTVEVVAGGGGTQVETQSSELSTVVSSNQISSLPSLTRNPYDFVATAGNVVEDPINNSNSGGSGAGVSINGQRAASTDILLDGSENVDEFSATVGQQVPLDSVQEFRVTSSDWSAEYGRASGGVVNVATKSGSNALHGSLYEYNRVSALATNTYDNNANNIPKAPFTRNQFGYSIGGPVVKNKLFFFNNTEWIRVRSTASQLAYIPDPAFLALTAPNTQGYFNAFGQVKPNVVPKGVLTASDLVANGTATGPAFSALPASTPVLDLVSFPFNSDVGGGSPQNTWMSVVRMDLNATDKTQLFGRYAVYHDNFFPGTLSFSPYVGFDTGEKDLNQNATFSLTHVFSPSLLSTSKLTFNRLNDVQPLSSRGAVPNMYYTLGGQVTINSQSTMLPGYLPTTTANSLPFGGPQNVAQLSESLSVTKGAHQFRFGGEYVYTRDNRVFGAYEEGEQFLARTSTSNAFDALINGAGLYRFSAAINPQQKFPCFHDATSGATLQTPACTLTGPAGPPNFARSNRYNDGSVYAQDAWKATNRLTLNLGLRWEYYGPQHDKHVANDANMVLGSGNSIYEQIANAVVLNGNNLPHGRLWEPQYHNFGPRAGFAYDLTGDGRTSIRGGYGLAYERNYGNVTFNVIQNPPNYAVLNITNKTDVPAGSITISSDNLGPAALPGTFAFRSPTLRAVDRHIKTAYAHMYNLSLERELAHNTVLALEYSGSRGIHQYSIGNINEFGYGPAFLGIGCNPGETQATCANGAQRLNLQYGNINYRSNGGDTYHNALNTRLQTNNIHNTGLTLNANYTYSHTIDELSATFGGIEYNANTLGPLNPFDPAADRADADYDARHRIVLSGVWAIPFAKDQRGISGRILGGWEVAPIITARTGFPLTAYDCTLANFNCPRYIPSGPVSRSLGSTSTAASAVQGPNLFTYATLPSPITYIDPSLTGSDVPTCASGTCRFPSNMLPRNFFRQPGFWNTNLSIAKGFKMTERTNLQFRAEFYNLFNHSNYYVQTGAFNNVSGFAADAALIPSNPATAALAATGNIECLTTAGCTPGVLEYTTASGAGIPGTIVGKKGSQTINQFGSLGERRFIQLALRIQF